LATFPVRSDAQALRTLLTQTLSQLLEEGGSAHPGIVLQDGTHLERDLGLGSLERVELLARLSTALERPLPDEALAAETVGELLGQLQNVLGEEPSATTAGPASAARSATSTQLISVPSTIESMTEVLRFRAATHPDRPYIFLHDGDREPQPLRFGELLELATRVARWLQFRGLEPGDRVALILPTSIEFLAAFFGILLAGGVPVPLYPPFRTDRLLEYAERQAGILRNAGARFLLTFGPAESLARLLGAQVPELERVALVARILEEQDKPVVAVFPSAGRHDLAFLQYTSGSTGDPKGVQVTHGNLLANLQAIGQALAISGDDVAVSWLPLYHDMGLIGAVLMTLYYGLPLGLLSPVSFLTRPARWLEAIHRHRATLTGGPNFAFELCLRKVTDEERARLDLSSLRGMLNGAEPVLPGTLARFAARFAPCGLRPEALMPVYGLAEATLLVSAPELGRAPRTDRIDRDLFETTGRAVPTDAPDALEFVSVGRPIGCQVRIVDADGRDCPERVEGQLWFRGPSATAGYFNNPQATAALVRPDGWRDSGDRAYVAEGELFITGRSKNIIIKGGRNLYPHEIETAAARVEGIRAGCVVAFGVSDAATGTERLVVAAESRRPAEARQQEAAIVQAVLDAVGVPPDLVRILPLHAIPKTSSGKLRRDETKRLFLAGQLGARRRPAWLQTLHLVAAAALARARRVGPLLRRGLEALYGTYALTMFGLWLVPTAAVVALLPPRAARRLTAWACRWYLRSVGCVVHVRNREILEQMRRGTLWPCVVAANHTSYLDVIVLLALLPPDCLYSAKQEVLRWPLLGLIARRMGELGFDRRNPRARVRQSEEIESTLASGLSVVIFPEGTFTPAPGIRPFLLGAFKAATQAQVPVVPVGLRGARAIWRDHTLLPRPGSVTVTFCEPLQATGSDWRSMVLLRDRTRRAVAEAAGEPLL
jgi:1-acyl-sn-glycerol-3-phosphate acyltransferase